MVGSAITAFLGGAYLSFRMYNAGVKYHDTRPVLSRRCHQIAIVAFLMTIIIPIAFGFMRMYL